MKNVSKLLVALLAVTAVSASAAPKQWLDYKGRKGPGKGKNIVLISGDEEYRSEEAMPLLAGILSIPRLQLPRGVCHRPQERAGRPKQPQQHSRTRGIKGR